MSEVNVKVIADHRKSISMVGANLGTQFFKTEARSCWPKFEEEKLTIAQSGDINLILNRSPRRYRLTGHDVISVQIGEDATGATKVFLNKDTEGQVSIPVTPGMEKIGVVTDDALGKALRGDNNIIFSDANKLAIQLNVLNNDEKTRLINLRDNINKMIAQIDSAIAENTKKANTYQNELLASTPETVPGSNHVTVTVED